VNYPEALAWLYGTQERGIKLGLDRVRAFLGEIGWQGKGRYLHVAGTNGKGSVCAMLDSICRAAGLRTGLFTSPHLVTFRERIRLAGEMAPKEEIADELTRMRGVCDAMQATFFEITTGLALTLFERHGVDLAVLETGLGGRLDSTNVVCPAVAVITSIGMDHMELLGGTLGEIAREKAGIIKRGVPVVTGPLPEEAGGVVAAIAAERGATWIQVTEPVGGYAVGLKGAHQRVNAAVALRAREAAGILVEPGVIAEGLRGVRWPGRFQDTGLGFVLDGAHNPDAARRLAETWREEYGAEPTEIILGVVAGKDARGICAELAPVARRFTIVPVRNPRGRPAAEVFEIAEGLRPSRVCGSLEEAIGTTPGGGKPALITGSLFLIGEALVCLGLAEGGQEISGQ